jgi:FKBP-type peptidyl-prolyl cis-trans isomerase FklB
MRLIPVRAAAAVITVGTLFSAGVLAAEPAMDEAARQHYALGYQLGRDLKAVEARPQDLAKGIEDGRKDAKPKLTEAEMQAALTSLQQKIGELRQQELAVLSQKAIGEGKAYLAENAKKPGVTTTASGLQYRMVQEGTGRTPTVDDMVTVNYKGKLVDGTEFDSSYKRGQPASFQVKGVIPGWTEALQLMKVGSKFDLAIPPELAYGSSGPLANQVLLFEVELLGATASQTETGSK